MAKGIMIVETRPADPSREDEYNDWYTKTHIPEVLAVPGILNAKRYKKHNPKDPSDIAYTAIYELEADNLTEPVKELGARTQTGEIQMSDVIAMDPPPVITIYEVAD